MQPIVIRDGVGALPPTGRVIVYAVYAVQGKHVVRKWERIAGIFCTPRIPHLTATTLQEARKSIPAGLEMLKAHELDDHTMVELWV